MIKEIKKRLMDELFIIGDDSIIFGNWYVQVGDKLYLISSGLLELFFKQKPEEAYVNADDFNNNKEILIALNGQKKK